MFPATISISKKTKSRGYSGLTKELMAFGVKHVLSLLFPVFIFCMLVISKLVAIPFLPRYDFLLIACIGMQAWMYLSRLESKMELLVITMFHLTGIVLEIYKVAMGSWYYPEFGYTKVLGVPLYSGFMYASVGSYVCQSWRRFRVKIENWPGNVFPLLIATSIYINFFTHHFFFDLRWLLAVILIIGFWKTKILFDTGFSDRKIPLVLSFLLLGILIWLGENLATLLGAWKYAYQHEGWKMVSISKISSWFLLIVLSIVIVVQLKLFRETRKLKFLRIHKDTRQPMAEYSSELG